MGLCTGYEHWLCDGVQAMSSDYVAWSLLFLVQKRTFIRGKLRTGMSNTKLMVTHIPSSAKNREWYLERSSIISM